MSDHFDLNEEHAPSQYSSFSKSAMGNVNTLQEPVMDTIVLFLSYSPGTWESSPRRSKLPFLGKVIMQNSKKNGTSGGLWSYPYSQQG